mgnify:CR=1 FL=1
MVLFFRVEELAEAKLVVAGAAPGSRAVGMHSGTAGA